MRAKIASLSPTFCHAVILETGVRVFVHQTESDFTVGQALIGDVIEIEEVEDTSRGPRARFATWVERPVLATIPQEHFEGIVVHVDSARKFLFARPKDKFTGSTAGRGPFDVMGHISAAADYDGDSRLFYALGRGVAITGTVRDTVRGRRLEGYTMSEGAVTR